MGSIVLVGAGGTGMSSVAMMLVDLGYQNIVAIDAVDSPLLQAMKDRGIKQVIIGHGIYQVQIDDIVIYSDVPSIVSGPEVTQSRIYQQSPTKKHFHICISYNQFIAEISKRFITIAVAGSNGKTSTTGMLIYTLSNLSDSQFGLGIVGGLMPNSDHHGYFINPSLQSDIRHLFDHIFDQKHQLDYSLLKKYSFVIEACEYRNHFLLYDVDYAIVTNIEWDHTDFFLTEESYRMAFLQFVYKVKHKAILTPSAYATLLSTLNEYGVHDQERIIAHCDKNCSVQSEPIEFHNKWIIGQYHNSNAGLIFALLEQLQFSITKEDYSILLESWKGMGRRMEYIGSTPQGAMIYTDYSHHAPAIQGNIQALKRVFPDRHIVVVFQPHQAQRVLVGRQDLIQALSGANSCFIYRLYTAREDFSQLQSHRSQLASLNSFEELGQSFAQALHAQYIRSREEIDLRQYGEDSVIVLFSAGDADQQLRDRM